VVDAMTALQLTLVILPDVLAVCRLPSASPGIFLPGSQAFQAIIRSPGEVTLICTASAAPAEAVIESGWRALMVRGPLPFSMTGVLAALAVPLSQAEISIFAVSTFDTDYILVKESALGAAAAALRNAGHRVLAGSASV
jgi:hypothetical protein